MVDVHAPSALRDPEWPADIVVLERGWLSSNNVVILSHDEASVVDTGYVSHADQTVALIGAVVGSRPLRTVVNTHSHSDHVGGNASLQAAFAPEIWIPSGIWAAVQRWDVDALSYRPTGQHCAAFTATRAFSSAQRLELSGRSFEVIAAPGHDPHSVVLFDARDGILISADALWHNGFGVVFPELEGIHAFDDVENVLDQLSRLPVRWVIPGHGPPFADFDDAIGRARARLGSHRKDPARHARHAAKVLIKFRMLEWKSRRHIDVATWATGVPLLNEIHARYARTTNMLSWIHELLDDLVRSGALSMSGPMIIDGD